MFSKVLIALTVLATANNLVSATPPACLLGAVNTQPNPADLKSICGQNASRVQTQIRSLCGANTGAAMNAFSSICSSAGHHVATAKHKTSTQKTTSKSHSTQSSSKGHTTKIIVTTKTSHKTPSKTSHKTSSLASHHATSTVKHSSGKILPTGKTITTSLSRETSTAGDAATTGGSSSGANSAPPSESSPKPFKGAAGHIDAHGFAELALAAAGLLIFL